MSLPEITECRILDGWESNVEGVVRLSQLFTAVDTLEAAEDISQGYAIRFSFAEGWTSTCGDLE